MITGIQRCRPQTAKQNLYSWFHGSLATKLRRQLSRSTRGQTFREAKQNSRRIWMVWLFCCVKPFQSSHNVKGQNRNA
jgi:hypothetical protein